MLQRVVEQKPPAKAGEQKPVKEMDTLEKIAREVRACKKCRLWKSRTKAVPGEGPKSAKLMLIGQAPGKNEDMTGRPFVGMAGKYLDTLLRKNKLDRRRVFITAPIKCFPPKNRRPKRDEMEACWPYLDRQLTIIKPRKVVLMGAVAFRAFFPGKDLKKHRGKWLALDHMRFLPTYHPAAGMRFPRVRRAMEQDFRKIVGTT